MEDPQTLSTRLDQLLSSLPIIHLEIFTSPVINTTQNPHHPFVLCDQHQLAIPQKVLAIIYAHVSQRFHCLYQTSQADQLTPSEEIFPLTRLLLIQNPDHLTALSIRRKLIMAHYSRDPDRLSNELELTKLLLSVPSHSKSTALWFHRRWAFNHLFPPSEPNLSLPNLPGSNENVDLSSKIYRPLADLPPQLLQAELEFSLKTCELYPRNYYGWFHRKWLVYQLVHSADRTSTTEVQLDAERARILRFVHLHPRDHSAANYITFLSSLSSSSSSVTPITPNPNNQPANLFILKSYTAFAGYPEFECSWSLLKFIVLSNTLSIEQSLALIQTSPVAHRLQLSFDSIPDFSCLTPSSEPQPKTATPSSSTITLADLHADAHRRSQVHCLRTLYFLGYHLKWIDWTDEIGKILIQPTFLPSSLQSAPVLRALKPLIDRFLG